MAPPPPPAATMPVAPPPVASIAPIQQAAPPSTEAPPPPPPIVAGAATTAAATPAGLRLTFANGQSDLSPGSADSIKHLVQTAPAGDATTFNVLAYATGDPADPSAARRLSLARAIAVRAVLMTDGVPSSRIYLRALGSPPGEQPPDRVDVSVLGANASQQ
jgi:outer membrane protein OmpA-like peptidoglycan-associated protein